MAQPIPMLPSAAVLLSTSLLIPVATAVLEVVLVAEDLVAALVAAVGGGNRR